MTDIPEPTGILKEQRKKGFRVTKIPKEKQQRMLRCYLEWFRGGFQTTGSFALERIAEEYEVEEADVLALAEHDPNLRTRIGKFVKNKAAVAHLVVVEEMKAIVSDPEKRKSVTTKDLARVGEFLAKSLGGEYTEKSTEKTPAVVLNLSLPKPDGYDDMRRLDARVKASEALGPDLLGGPDHGDEDTPVRQGD